MCAPTSPSIQDQLSLQPGYKGPSTVVATTYFNRAFDHGPGFPTWVAMCAAAGLNVRVSLALGLDAFSTALAVEPHGVVHSSSLSTYALGQQKGSFQIKVLPGDYSARRDISLAWDNYSQHHTVHGRVGQMDVGHAVNRVRLLWLSLLLRAGVSPLCIELDVALMQPILPALDAFVYSKNGLLNRTTHELLNATTPPRRPYDIISMSCKKAPLHNRVNLGLQLFRPADETRRRKLTEFLETVTCKAMAKLSWDQEEFNRELIGRRKTPREMMGAEAWFTPDVLLLEICDSLEHAAWQANSQMMILADEVQRAGNVRAALASSTRRRMVAMHMIGSGYKLRGTRYQFPKADVLHDAMLLDPHPAALTGRTGYVALLTPDLSEGSSLTASMDAAVSSHGQGVHHHHVLRNASMLAALRRDSVVLTLALAAATRRTPVLTLHPPRRCTLNASTGDRSCEPRSKRCSSGQTAGCYSYAYLRDKGCGNGTSAIGGFLPASFLHGYAFYNASTIPRWSDATWVQGPTAAEAAFAFNGSDAERSFSAADSQQPEVWQRASASDDLVILKTFRAAELEPTTRIESRHRAAGHTTLDEFISPTALPTWHWAEQLRAALSLVPASLRDRVSRCVIDVGNSYGAFSSPCAAQCNI